MCTVLYYCHWVSTQLQLTNISISVSFSLIFPNHLQRSRVYFFTCLQIDFLAKYLDLSKRVLGGGNREYWEVEILCKTSFGTNFFLVMFFLNFLDICCSVRVWTNFCRLNCRILCYFLFWIICCVSLVTHIDILIFSNLSSQVCCTLIVY